MSSRGAGLGGAILRLAALLGMALNLPAQTGSGEIHLQVTDPSGAPMQASVRVRGQKAKLDRTVITNAKSPTVLANLPFGRYRL